MITQKIEFSLNCEKHNHPLEVNQTNYDQKKEFFRMYVVPCPDCVELARQEGIVEGMEKAKEVLEAIKP